MSILNDKNGNQSPANTDISQYDTEVLIPHAVIESSQFSMSPNNRFSSSIMDINDTQESEICEENSGNIIEEFSTETKSSHQAIPYKVTKQTQMSEIQHISSTHLINNSVSTTFRNSVLKYPKDFNISIDGVSNMRSTPSLSVASYSKTKNKEDISFALGRKSSTFGTHQSSSSTYHQSQTGYFIVSVAEFTNRQQIGIAAIDTQNSKVYLSQFRDNHMYTNTLALLNCYDPSIILMSDTSTDSVLYYLIERDFQLAQVKPIKRKYFNETIGIEFIQRLCLRQQADSLDLQPSKYLCIAACACLLKYLEFQQEITYAHGSLSITMNSIDGYMQIDMNTAATLELVRSNSLVNGKESSSTVYSNTTSKKIRNSSLFDILNHTKTRSGSKLLRTTILQPLNDKATLQMRLDAVESIISDETLFFQLSAIFSSLGDLDTICSSLIYIPRKLSLSIAQNQISQMLLLKSILPNIETLHTILSKSKNELLLALASTLVSDSKVEIENMITATINQEVVINKSNVEQYRTQIVYAIQSGIDSMLDVARETYCEALEDLYSEATRTIHSFNLTGAKLHYTTTRGYHLVVPAISLPPERHTSSITNRVYKGNKVYCSTSALHSLENRQQEAFHDACFFTSKVVGNLVASIRNYISWLYAVNDSISMLDMLTSFANHAIINSNYVRPQLSDDGPIVIQQGRHPIIETRNTSLDPNVPNDSYITTLNNLLIVTGPNNSGKSTYIRQVAILVLMAHLGTYIPAKIASVRITDAIYSCTGSFNSSANYTFSADSDRSTSSFYTEMREMSRILANVTSKSLVILDEVGKSTSNIDGVAISWSLCESLVATRCFCLYATHFIELVELADLYPMVKTICLQVEYSNKQSLLSGEDVNDNTNTDSVTPDRRSIIPAMQSDDLQALKRSRDVNFVEPTISSTSSQSTLKYIFKVTSGSTSDQCAFYGIAIAQAAAFPIPVIANAHLISNKLQEKRITKEPNISILKSSALYTLIARLLSLQHTTTCTRSMQDIRRLLLDISENFASEVTKIQNIAHKNTN